ncbi:MAG: UvrD-helicase domain-containing protein [Bacteroidales bacterium]|nr:UvrD-helicase domain-containing protein [Bacteroidales bacterium]
MFNIYKSSAGSGKTSRLVVEYLSLCLPHPEKFKHILAITFTNNATAEMKSRIVNMLSLLTFESEITECSPVYHTYNQIVANIATQLPEDEQFVYIKNQSKILLENILYGYDKFSISTIDAFFQRLLRAFALEFGLNSQFNLEIELDDFHRETTKVLLQRVSKNNIELTQRMLELVENNMLEKGKWKVEKEIIGLLEKCMKEEVYFPLKKLQESENNNFDYAKKIIIQEKKRIRGELKTFTTAAEKKSDTCRLFKEQLKEMEFFGKNLFQLALLFDLKSIMDEIKAEENRFFISETNAKISEKLEEDDVPFIYEKIGNQYSYFFIDEFQDTSKLQWKNMLPLLRDALTGTNKFSEQGKVFLFGDVKQAIYRFRNGDTDILQQLTNLGGYQKTVLQYAQQDKDYSVKLLDTNYRSSKKVVEFNNAFFSYLTSENAPFSEAKDYYTDVIQKMKPTSPEGNVSVRFQEENDLRKFEEYLLEPVLETIYALLHKGYSYRDIAILVSSNKLASKIGSFLIANNIAIISADSLHLSASSEINLLIAALQYIISQEDKLSKLFIVQYFTEQNNLLLEEYLQYVQNEETFQQFLTLYNIKINRKKLLSLSLFTLMNELIQIFSFSLLNPFLMRFLDETEGFSSKRIGIITLFLEWWEEEGHKITLSSPQGIDAVTVSTIHKSKGMEYPAVILPLGRYGNRKTVPDIFIQDTVTGLEYDFVTLTDTHTPARFQQLNDEESKKTKIDNLNKLYVAHTRAREELHIITEKPEGRGVNYSKFLAEFCERNEEWDASTLPSNQVEKGELRKEICELGISVLNNNQKPARLNNVFSITMEETTIAQHRGIYLHNYLSSLTSYQQNEEEIESVLLSVEETYRETLRQIFHKILNDEVLRPCFAPGVKVLNETSILFPNGNLLRPDRVVFLEDKVVVIDYKTGEPHISHKEQIDEYCVAVRDMGYRNVRGVLLYV